MAARVVFYFEDGSPYVTTGIYNMSKIILIKGDIQEQTQRKIVAHFVEFLTIGELDKEMFIVRPMRM